jgi:hypothetical protein
MNGRKDVVRLKAALRHLRKAHDQLCCVTHNSDEFKNALNQCRATIASVQYDLWDVPRPVPREPARAQPVAPQ